MTDELQRRADEISAADRAEDTNLGYYDHDEDEDAGYEDALAGRPRESSRAWYRRGYDRGLTVAIQRGNQ